MEELNIISPLSKINLFGSIKYKASGFKIDVTKAENFNLILNRVFPTILKKYGNSISGIKNDKKLKFNFHKEIIEHVNAYKLNYRTLLEDKKKILETTIRTYPEKCILELQTKSNLIVGLGQEHGTETGLTTHPLFGYPYIPASAIKGMVRGWLALAEDTFNGETIDDEDQLKERLDEESYRIFGSKITGGEDNKLGSVLFYDAIPTDFPKLKLDVMTPHFPKYYSGGDNLPSETESPNPITFISVAPEQTFLFAIASKNEEDFYSAIKWLVDGLTQIGIGAKTSVGYGRFEKPNGKTKEKYELACLSIGERAQRKELKKEQEKLEKEAEKDRNRLEKEARIKEIISFAKSPGVSLDKIFAQIENQDITLKNKICSMCKKRINKKVKEKGSNSPEYLLKMKSWII